MKNRDVFVGTIKKCNDLYCYKKYGETRYVGDFALRNIEVGQIQHYTDVVDDKAILIKIDEDKYVWLNSVMTIFDELLVDIGIPVNTISTVPSTDNELFVDKKSLVQYFDHSGDKKLKVKTLKKIVR